MSPLTIKAQSLKFESKTLWSTARRPQKPRKAQESHLKEGKSQNPANSMKSGKAKQNGKEEIEKAQEEQEKLKPRQKLKISTKAQNQHSSEINSP
jgi:hypothetical protein